MKFHRLFSLLLISCFLQGCMLSGRMTRIVSEHYAPKAKLRVQDSPAWLILKTDSLERVNGYCQARYKRFFTVPLIVYIYSDEKIECKINPKIYVNALSSAVQNQLKNSSFENKLNGRILEISVNHVPTTFYHRYYSHYITVQLLVQNLYFSITENELYNKAGAIRLSYTLRDQSTMNVIKTGNLSSGIAGNFYVKNYSQRRLYFVQDFVSSFDNQLEAAVNQLANDLIYQL